MTNAPSAHRTAIATTVGLTFGGLAYFAILLNFSWDLTRKATSIGYASNFFDIQANSFLHHHLDVPTGSLGIEGFVRNGHTYMYYGPFPALLRVPVQLVTHQYDGKLSLVSMALAWVVFATMTARLFWLARRTLRPGVPIGRVDAVFGAIFLAAATGGTSLTFDAGLPWVYHEVYLWSVALVVGSLYWLVRVLLDPTPRAMWWLGGFALCGVLTRSTGGWAACGAIILGGLWIATDRPHPARRHLALGVLAAGVLPVVVSIALNYAKFRHPYLFPLQDQVFTRVDAHRREALRLNGGTIVGPQFFWTSFVNYFRLDGIRFVDYFPWITLPGQPARAYGGAFIDQSYRTGSVTSFMTLLLVLSLGSVPVLFRRGVSMAHKAFRLALVGGVAVTAGVMDYGYLASRYTSEFVPALVVGGAVMTVALTGSVTRWRWWRVATPVAAVLAAATAFAIVANMATGYASAAVQYRGDPLATYLGVQSRLSSSDSLRRLVTLSAAMPHGGRADDLWIRGSCQALYVNTGESSEKWVLVKERDHMMTIYSAPTVHNAKLLLFRIHSITPSSVWLTISSRRVVQVFVHNPTGNYYGQPFDLAPLATIRVGVRNLSELGFAEVSSLPGGFAGFVPTEEWNRDWVTRLGRIQPVVPSAAAQRHAGIGVTSSVGPAPAICTELLQRARMHAASAV